jgi:putative SOS response-associated peptidase YedK
MCGRYRLSRRKQIIGEYFDTADWQDDWSPRYNIAPTQSVPVVRQHPKENVKQLSLMKWGLIPNWASDPAIASRTINAKSETAATKPAFRDPLKYRRCLIPADGFYEWMRSTTSKQPFCFEPLATLSCISRITIVKTSTSYSACASPATTAATLSSIWFQPSS